MITATVMTPAEFVAFVHELDPKPVAYGANCGVGAPDLAVTIMQLAAASLLISIPVVLMYGFGQRFLTEGLTAGAVKG